MDTSSEQIDLLLASVREHKPVLDDGISSDATNDAPKVKKPKNNETHQRRDRSADRSHLDVQRWGVVIPDGRAGNALLEAIKPLIELRKDEQGVEPIVFRIPPNMDQNATLEWLSTKYDCEDIEEIDRPYYLCLLGSPEQTSLDFQHTVANSAYIGRIHFDKPDGDVDIDAYAAYAQKVVDYATKGFTEEPPDLMYYVAPDGTKATRNAIPKLVSPSLESSQRAVDKGRLSAVVRQIDAHSIESFLSANATLTKENNARPSVLLSVSHGLGGSEDDYGSYDAQRMQQGALVLGPKQLLDAEAITGKTFLPGGLWLLFACFGAGTPATSEYYKWLKQLAQEGVYRESAKAVLNSLAISGTGFIAALPQAALRNPKGPLAVVGHIDLAWNFSYINPNNPSESRSSKFTKVLHTMAKGARVGCAHDEITEGFRVANFELTSMYESSDDARFAKTADPTDPKKRGRIWMVRNDLRGYVVLGDPAVRLAQYEPRERIARTKKPDVPEIQTTTRSGAAISAAAKESAVSALLEGNETPRAIAERTGCSLAQLFAWFETHRAVEREKLV